MESGLAMGYGPAMGSGPVTGPGLAKGARAAIPGACQFQLNFCFKIFDNFVEICNSSHYEVQIFPI